MADINDAGLLSAPEAALLIDQYELAMAAGYLRHDMNEPATFELFARRLPPNRDWLLACGLGPTLRLLAELRFGERQLSDLRELGFGAQLLEYLAEYRFSGEIEAMPEGTLAFANEPLLRVTAPRVDAQLLETILLNQIDFQTMVATKAARVVLAAGGGEPGAGETLFDFSARRTHGSDAAMKVARAAAVAGFGGTSNIAAALRYGLQAVGTMAHSYVLSFESEAEAFRAFMEDNPDNALILVDTYETAEGVRRAIDASRASGVPLAGVRIDSGDLLALSQQARRLLDEAGMEEARIVVSGDLEEGRISELVAAGAPIDLWGVGTELGTSRDSPAINGVYKLVADRTGGVWRGVAKSSEGKATVPGAKQVFRTLADGEFAGDVIGGTDEDLEGEPLLVPAMRGGEIVLTETIEQMRERTNRSLGSLPPALRRDGAEPYPVAYSARLEAAARG
ncbi:MAG: nicotinate phosphoribosyltransferase [Solirubrobacterales bacterium]